jgi:hypothetical protein
MTGPLAFCPVHRRARLDQEGCRSQRLSPGMGSDVANDELISIRRRLRDSIRCEGSPAAAIELINSLNLTGLSKRTHRRNVCNRDPLNRAMIRVGGPTGGTIGLLVHDNAFYLPIQRAVTAAPGVVHFAGPTPPTHQGGGQCVGSTRRNGRSMAAARRFSAEASAAVLVSANVLTIAMSAAIAPDSRRTQPCSGRSGHCPSFVRASI